MSEVKKLKAEYSKIFSKKENRPEWAVKKYNSTELVHPSIPFVGNNYSKTKVLVYASAENLMYYIKNDKAFNLLDNNENAINRHRFSFENYSENKFFPYVHIAPIDDGSLLTVTSYILKKLNIIFYKNPFDLVKSISLANFGKFSIETKMKNKDYASDSKYLKYSLPYIKADLSILKPQIIIMPVKIYEKEKIHNDIKKYLPSITVIPIYQINSRNINFKIKKFKKKEISEISDFYEWQKHLSNGIVGKTNDNFLSVYTYIDNVLNSIQ